MSSSIISAVQWIILRELENLHKEIDAYKLESDIWKVSGEISNSAGNLCLHICGNLRHFIGAVIGKDGYLRNRDLEFSARGLSKTELVSAIGATKNAVTDALNHADERLISGDYPLPFHNERVKTDFFLIHLTAHLQYHLGQINYHRRLLGSK
jgi:hypothetical protein